MAEFLLGCEDLRECGQRSVDWLVEHAGAREAVCLCLDLQENRLAPIASLGLPASVRDELSCDVEDLKHPLIAVLHGRRHQVLSRGAPGASRWLSGSRLLVVPLYGLFAGEDVPVGLLIAAPVTSELTRDARWLADLLGHRLVRLTRQRALTDSDRLLRRERTLLDAVPDPILLTDNEGRLLIANSQAQKLLASRDDESEGRRRAVALNNMFFSSALAQTAVPGEAHGRRRELVLVDPIEGTDLVFEMLNTVATDAKEGSGVVSVLRNVTDLRRATEEIEENYRRLRLAEADVRAERDRLDLIIDSVADPILVTDPSGAIVLMNAPAERLFTLSRDAGPDESVRITANDAHFSSFLSNLFIAGDEVRRRGFVGLVDPPSGTPMPVEAISGKILSEHGEVIAVVTILHDRTEQIEKARLYEQLKQASEGLERKVGEATAELLRRNELLDRQRLALEQASHLKSQFLANMSHEFRTPLNAIMGYTSMLLQGVNGELLPTQQRNLERVDSNARHLLSIINDILDISRIEAGRMPLHLTDFSLRELLVEVVAELEPIIERSRLTVSTRLAPAVPRLYSDRAKVKQILVNLLTNAIKFTSKGSVSVTAEPVRGSADVRIKVIDTGIGIADSDQGKIFEDFRQADSSPAREYGGAGLGLAICRRLARMLGGAISVTSAVGKGSTFTLDLPKRTRR
jgi:PAS domain S-box-containing protein